MKTCRKLLDFTSPPPVFYLVWMSQNFKWDINIHQFSEDLHNEFSYSNHFMYRLSSCVKLNSVQTSPKYWHFFYVTSSSPYSKNLLISLDCLTLPSPLRSFYRRGNSTGRRIEGRDSVDNLWTEPSRRRSSSTLVSQIGIRNS